ncbi:MAG: hypothetical protein OXU51_16695 [Candidatus Poribacteria bacterium]|nr:hypothetical protein [Candidatus Poribacteria bacterium]
MDQNTPAIISCIVAVLSFLGVILFTGLQLSRKIVDAFKIEILRLFYSEPTTSIFQWCRKTTNSGILPIFSEIKGFFPAYLRSRFCERYFASALAEVKNDFGETEYLKRINYDESVSAQRRQIFKFIENHEKKFRAAIRGEDFHSVRCLIDTHKQELRDALINNKRYQN